MPQSDSQPIFQLTPDLHFERFRHEWLALDQADEAVYRISGPAAEVVAALIGGCGRLSGRHLAVAEELRSAGLIVRAETTSGLLSRRRMMIGTGSLAAIGLVSFKLPAAAAASSIPTAEGGIVSTLSIDSEEYWLHEFRVIDGSSGPFQFRVISGTFQADILLVGGGGGGGNSSTQNDGGGGGGGGGVRQLLGVNAVAVSPTGGVGGDGVYSVTVGVGGGGNVNGRGSQGGNSSFQVQVSESYLAYGGGGGGGASPNNAGAPTEASSVFGSGGGGSGLTGASAGGVENAGAGGGKAGGAAFSSNGTQRSGGGGGGAAVAGAAGASGAGGAGGAGFNAIDFFGSATYFGGGGGGGAFTTGGAGGLGGGGAAGQGTARQAAAGTAHTGGGGGGGYKGDSTNATLAPGGSGVVFVRYRK